MADRSKESEIVELHAIFRGRVQGVGFRYRTEDYASRLGVCGTVRNLRDGAVEVRAQGKRQVLERLIQLLQENVGHVETVEADYSIPGKLFEDFRIIS